MTRYRAPDQWQAFRHELLVRRLRREMSRDDHRHWWPAAWVYAGVALFVIGFWAAVVWLMFWLAR
jgi:hypothetical protein